jgi:ParB family transcriptional regulator, chromosome partitioning protein
VIAKRLSVREAERLVARTGTGKGRQAPLLRVKHEKPRDLQRIEQSLSDALLASVEIRVKKRTRKGEQGEVAIQFGSLEELNGLLDKLGLQVA